MQRCLSSAASLRPLHRGAMHADPRCNHPPGVRHGSLHPYDCRASVRPSTTLRPRLPLVLHAGWPASRFPTPMRRHATPAACPALSPRAVSPGTIACGGTVTLSQLASPQARRRADRRPRECRAAAWSPPSLAPAAIPFRLTSPPPPPLPLLSVPSARPALRQPDPCLLPRPAVAIACTCRRTSRALPARRRRVPWSAPQPWGHVAPSLRAVR
jgi:hypothetical protein